MFLFSLIICDSACCCAYISSVLHLYIQHVASIHPTRCIYTSIAQTHYMSIIHHRNGSLQCPQHSYVAHQFPCKHGRGGQHQITAHEAQCNGYGLSHKRQKGEESHQCPFPLEEMLHPFYLFPFHLEIFLNPVYTSQTSHVVARHASQRISQGGGEYAQCRAQTDLDQCYHHYLGTERNDASCH